MKLPLLTLTLSLSAALAQDREGIAFFEARIRPALAKYCYECHSEESGKAKGGLRVDSQHALLQGGDTGPAIVPGDLEKSLFVTAIRYEDEDFEMPPKGKLPADVIADFEKWIAMGAPDPRTDAAPVTVRTEIDIEAGRQFWAFQPPNKPTTPTVINTNWPRNDIDRFVLAKMDENKLAPSPDANPRTLVRRLYFVLAGLPPSAEDVEKWTRAIGPNLDQAAVAQFVDHLLASPRFGERWGQHWLDVARYAESTGGDSNNIFPHAWRYRDYVIDSFNDDKPFDQFIREQLAGDLLPIANDREWADNLVATGFLALGQKLVGEVEDRKFFADLVDEQIDATTRAFLGLTVSCARCHDHKTDPIPQTDYYALATIFRNTTTHYGLLRAQARQFSTLIDATGLGLPSGRDTLTPTEFTQLRTERDAAAQKMEDLMRDIRNGEKVTRATLRRSRTKRDETEHALQSYDESGNPFTFVMSTQDREAKLDTRVFVRGELDKPGQLVEPGFVQVAYRGELPNFEGSGRLQLADWIADAENPLTARVMANRVWHWLFGQGLVRSLDDFGATGEKPSHPELLDHLAIRLVEHDWSLKELIREIVLSRTWQQSSRFQSSHFVIDPENRFLWRASQRRLEAEAIRDAMLVVSGNLDPNRPPKPLLNAVGEGTVGQSVFEPEIRKIDVNHRSVYLPRVRNVLPNSLELFDAPDASNVTGARETTTVPLQALYAMNHDFVRRQAEAFAARLEREPTKTRIEFAHLTAFGRPPTDRERRMGALFAQKYRADERGIDNTELQRKTLAAYCQALMCAAEFGVID